MQNMLELTIELLFVLTCLFSNPEKNVNEINIMQGDVVSVSFFVTHEKISNDKETGKEKDQDIAGYCYSAYETPELTQKLFDVKNGESVYDIVIMGYKTEYKKEHLIIPEIPKGSNITQNIMGFNIGLINKSGKIKIKPKNSQIWLLIN